MAKVLLVKMTKSFAGDKALSPPLGLLYLAAYLRRERPGDEIRLLDLRLARGGARAMEDALRGFEPDLIGLSAMTIEAATLHAAAAWCKGRLPRVPILAGGPHASSFGPQVLADANIDYALAGEGEKGFVAFVAALEAGRREPVISGLMHRARGGGITAHPPNQDLVDLADLPYPAWDLHDFDRYTDSRMASISHGRYAAVFTSRGCPYQCTYCHQIFTKRFRAMPPERVLDELEHVVRTYGIREFEIYDDTFNLDYGRAAAICDGIVRRGLNLRLLFPNGVRGDLLDEALIRKLRQAGAIHMVFAVESASPRIQKDIKKNVNLPKLRQVIRLAAREGIFAWGFFMLGFPKETRRELWRTLRYAWSSALHGAYFFIVVPQAGTELARQAGLDVGRYADITATDYFTMKNTIAGVSHWELWLYQQLALLLFYGNPLRIWRAIRVYPYPIRVFFDKAFRRGALFFLMAFFRSLTYRFRKQASPGGAAEAFAGRPAPDSSLSP